ncbi:hypothetical protein [Brevundimonas sp. A19_0]|uniref:hypothetical protein n=1 Tax=Brevundimonas sp. A19_0 TaxID=2821087 RepID=UPI001ADAE998|nr:hypothetical protein [Brevundimonas sp. A19_0]MBO9502512.1 hypothetical protein [Brevundimonas sp. A19_0]
MSAAQAAAGAAAKISNLMVGIGGWQASRARAAALKQAAKMARAEASMQGQMMADEGERVAAEAAVRGAAMGGGFEGSFDDVLRSIEQTAAFNARSAIWSGNVEAANRLYEARVAKQEGTMQLISSIVGTGASIAGDWMGQAQQRQQRQILNRMKARYGVRATR